MCCGALPVGPATDFLCCRGKCGQPVCVQHVDGALGLQPSRDDIAYGDHVIGPTDSGRSPLTMKFPDELAPAQWAEHMAAHLPFCSGCPYCTAGKKPKLHHRRPDHPRTPRHVTADYGFLRDSVADAVVPFLAVYISPFKL